MEKNSVIFLIVFGLAVIALIFFLIWKNQKDKKLLDPDAPDSVEETHHDQLRDTDKI